MIILDTVAHETIWGGQKLLPYAKEKPGKIGHLYSLCCEKGLENTILNGEYKGRVFQDYFEENRQRFGLEGYDEFPLIIALVEARDDLSIQVHPDDEMAKREEGAAYGKNESWFFIEAPESGSLYNGCLAESAEEVRDRLQSGDMMSIVGRLQVKPGDYVYVKAGTMHAMTTGSFVYEIEENSPWTYRLYDYDRVDASGNHRELHIEKGLRALKPGLISESIPMDDKWVTERRYKLLKLTDTAEYRNESDTLQCFTVIFGKGFAEGLDITTGTTVVLEPGDRIEGSFDLAMVAEPV